MLEKILEEIEEVTKQEDAPIYCGSMEVDGYVRMSRVEEIIRKYTNDGWIPTEERLPEDEARKFIKEELGGIGYLYPCLLTYRSPNTERVHVVRFYYDVYKKWFVNAGEELCEKERCFAWRPLPEPYRPEIQGDLLREIVGVGQEGEAE